MKITNAEIAVALIHIADVLKEQEENPYRIRAYRRAANAIKKHPESVQALLLAEQDITHIRHVGEKIQKLLVEMIATNNLTFEPKSETPKALPDYLIQKRRQKKFRIHSMVPVVERLCKRLLAIAEIKKFEFAGEYRRRHETISQLIVVIATDNPSATFDSVLKLPGIKYFISRDDSVLAVQLKVGIELILHAVKEAEFATALWNLTGSDTHVKAVHAIVRNKFPKRLPSEREMYARLKLAYIPPELRENRGEILAAQQGKLPQLIELADIKGDLHCHTNETDGSFTLEEMVQAVMQQGYRYVAITDHSQSLKITHGMDEKRLLKQIEKINKLNSTLSNFTILKSMEIDILEDGSLDLSMDVLKELDLTVCSIHSKFQLPLEQQTERIIRAMDNPYFTILGHATGRLLTHRPPYQIDIDSVLRAAKERHCFIELNAQPARLDINDVYCKKAKELGVKVAISSDAHTTAGFQFMVLGVNQARRGWLEAADVINTYELSALRRLIKK